jgi:isopentenyldiphosphate isomerase
MSEEMFDIYDENNKPTGVQKPRKVVHDELKDWHRTTHIWVVNDKGEFLCQQRSKKKDVNPGKWMSFFGGHLKAGQSYESNALSELKEELGLNSITESDLMPVRIGKDDDVRHFGQVYVVRWNGNIDDVHFDDGEVEKVKWSGLDELQDEIDKGMYCNGVDETVLEYLANH